MSTDNSKKYSLYLENKADNLKKTLEYFLAETSNNHETSASEKRVIFLSQVDFWSWEMDELIYSFLSFEERKKSWNSYHGIAEALSKNNIILKTNVLESVKSGRRGANKTIERVWSEKREDYVYDWVDKKDLKKVPIVNLNETIKTWNKLIDICQKIVFHNKALGDKIHTESLVGLDKFKKEEIVNAEKISS